MARPRAGPSPSHAPAHTHGRTEGEGGRRDGRPCASASCYLVQFDIGVRTRFYKGGNLIAFSTSSHGWRPNSLGFLLSYHFRLTGTCATRSAEQHQTAASRLWMRTEEHARRRGRGPRTLARTVEADPADACGRGPRSPRGRRGQRRMADAARRCRHSPHGGDASSIYDAVGQRGGMNDGGTERGRWHYEAWKGDDRTRVSSFCPCTSITLHSTCASCTSGIVFTPTTAEWRDLSFGSGDEGVGGGARRPALLPRTPLPASAPATLARRPCCRRALS
jgi:hypothetical protein